MKPSRGRGMSVLEAGKSAPPLDAVVIGGGPPPAAGAPFPRRYATALVERGRLGDQAPP